MRGQTRQAATVAVLVAVAVALIAISSVLPTVRLAFSAVAGVCVAVAVMFFGLRAGALTYAAAGILSLMIAPAKGTAVFFIVFFGLYALLKSLIERLKKLWLEWVLKLAAFNGILALAVFFSEALLISDMLPTAEALPFAWLLPLLWVLANGVFVIYDIGLSQLLARLYRLLAPIVEKGGGQ
ncbi:hypothetical protein LJC32_00240 [Oscillospiraceae bacterium OttesenSCG-928-F05]|nr:hypothetical protein [Oscillospiraceae bacterium OttesenSCG-928-F05]